jgi:NAD(P)-dependent dehydrogenase (short-subunit alcohol dehydrogenase family)
MEEEAVQKTVIITGGTKGIGRAIALKLARENHKLVLNYRADDKSAHETLSLCKEVNPHVLLFKADIANKQRVEEMAREAFNVFGAIDVLINNAGLNIDKPLHDLTEADWDRVVDTNMKGVFLCSQIASRYMLQQEREGIILNIGATTGIRGRVNGINYCASKAGVLIMTKCLALELAPKIRVNCVIPGMTRTQELVERFGLDDPETERNVLKMVPLGRVAMPEEVADIVNFMISHEARYMTGQKIIVDGGQFMF